MMDPNCENPSMAPAPMDWISTGKDSVSIITTMKYPEAEHMSLLTCHHPHDHDQQGAKELRGSNRRTDKEKCEEGSDPIGYC